MYVYSVSKKARNYYQHDICIIFKNIIIFWFKSNFKNALSIVNILISKDKNEGIECVI